MKVILEWILKYVRVVKKSNFVEFITAIIVGVLSIAILLQVVCRYILNLPLAWSEELSRFLLIWVTLLGGAIGIKRKIHFAIDVIVRRFSENMRKNLAFFSNIFLFIVIFDIFILKGISLCLMTYEQTSPALSIRMSWIYLSLVIGGALSCTYIFEDILSFIVSFIGLRTTNKAEGSKR